MRPVFLRFGDISLPPGAGFSEGDESIAAYAVTRAVNGIETAQRGRICTGQSRRMLLLGKISVNLCAADESISAVVQEWEVGMEGSP